MLNKIIMKKEFLFTSVILLLLVLFIGCKKDDNFHTLETEVSISENVSYGSFISAIGSTNKLILQIEIPDKSGFRNNQTSVTSPNASMSQVFQIDTSRIVAVKNNNNETYFSMRLVSKKDSSNNCFYNLYVKKDSNNQITQTIVKYLPMAKTIKSNYKNFEAKCFVLHNSMNNGVSSGATITNNSVHSLQATTSGCVEVAFDVPCDYGYVHHTDGPSPWCDANGSTRYLFLDCNGSGGTSGTGTGTTGGGIPGGTGSGGNVIITPGSSNTIISCEVPETDQFINQLYSNNIGWASQNVNTFNQVCGSLCGDASQTNIDNIQQTIDYLVHYPNGNIPENSIFFEAADPSAKVDINKIMKCFDNIPNVGATFSVKLCVDVPNNSNPDELWNFSKRAGHTFITMTKTNGSQSITQSFGFYPNTGVKAADFGGTNSAIKNDGLPPLGRSEYNASLTMPNLTATQFQTLINTSKSRSAFQYDLDDNNCAHFGVDVLNSIRGTSQINSVGKTANVYVPPASFIPVQFTQSPSGLYQKLVALKNAGGVDAPNIEIGILNYGQISKGECN